MGSSLRAAVMLAALVLGPGGTRADCPTPEDTVRALLRWAEGTRTDVYSVVGPPPLAASGRRLADGSYRTRLGFLVSRECMSVAGVTPASIERTLAEMTRVARQCARNRLPAYTEALFNGALGDRAEIRCRPNGCAAGSAACASGNGINFREESALQEPSTWFHELMHVAGADNQGACTHNSVGKNLNAKLRDEVYFWESACFRPGELLDFQREGTRDICRRPLTSYAERPHRVRHSRSTIARTCGFFDEYLRLESAHLGLLRTDVWPTAFACPPGKTCPPIAELNQRLSAAGLGNKVLPTNDTVATWTRDRCAIENGDTATAPWLNVRACLVKAEASWLEAVRASVTSGQLSAGDGQAYEDYLKRISGAASILADSVGDATDLMESGVNGKGQESLLRTIRSCQGNELAATTFCERVRDQAAHSAARLLAHWDRATPNGVTLEDAAR